MSMYVKFWRDAIVGWLIKIENHLISQIWIILLNNNNDNNNNDNDNKNKNMNMNKKNKNNNKNNNKNKNKNKNNIYFAHLDFTILIQFG